MRLKTTKRLLNLASLVVVGTAGAVGYWGLTPVLSIAFDRPAGDAAALNASKPGAAKTNSSVPASATVGLGGTGVVMDLPRALRRPLYDPPPPAPVVVAKAPLQPIRARLLATVIESEDSTAMLKLANGQVVFRKVGESLGAEEPSVEIVKIESGSILVRRGKEETRLSVEGMNGK